MGRNGAGKTLNDKYYIGFFKRDKLIAVMDLVMNYPKKKTAFIGPFMMDVNYQNKGIGSRVIGEVLSYLKSENYEKIRLGVDKGNPQSYSFRSDLSSDSEYVFERKIK